MEFFSPKLLFSPMVGNAASFYYVHIYDEFVLRVGN